MNERIFYSEYFYQKGSKETDILEKNANEYPCSSLAAFLLLYHYKKNSHQDFEKLAKKTALLFNNPHWLQFQLYNKFSPTQEIISQENFQKEIQISTEVKDELPIEISPVQNFMEDSDEAKEYMTSGITVHEIINEPNEIITETIPETLPEENPQHEIEIKEISEETALSDSFQLKESFANENAENESKQVQEIIDEPNEITTETIPETLHEESHQKEIEIKENYEETTVSNSLQQQESIAQKNAESEDEVITFEPLHTVDYFASQGIKINEELLTNDKLGSQMKSFTAWLKSMKKLHPGKLEEQSLATEKLIQTSADESNINTEILTEAMAEVLIKQNKKEKAIEMFSKLSLINPSKSAYFAARIESIKSN